MKRVQFCINFIFFYLVHFSECISLETCCNCDEPTVTYNVPKGLGTANMVHFVNLERTLKMDQRVDSLKSLLHESDKPFFCHLPSNIAVILGECSKRDHG